MTIPNLLTLFRGVATVAILMLFFTPLEDRYIYIYILFILAAVSDYLDGLLSRRWKQTSDFGAVVDPLFDKILVITLMFLLYPFDIVPAIFLLMLLIRDIATDVLRSHLLGKGITSPAIFSAKVKTASQMLMLNFMLLYLIFQDIYQLKALAIIFAFAAVVFSLWSAGVYLRNFIAFERNEAKSSRK